MDLQEIFMSIEEGASLTNYEIDDLARKLRIIKPKWYYAMRIIFYVLLVSLNLVLYLNVDFFCGFIFSIVSLLSCYFLKKSLNDTKNIKIYIAKIKAYYEKKFAEYQDFTLTIVKHEVLLNEGITTRIAYLFGDGYEFYLIDDKLKDTPYLLPNEYRTEKVMKPILKVFDSGFVERKAVFFKLTDILFYRVFNFDKGSYLCLNIDDIVVKSIDDETLKSFVWIQLKNQGVLKLSIDALEYLRLVAPSKEKRD